MFGHGAIFGVRSSALLLNNSQLLAVVVSKRREISAPLFNLVCSDDCIMSPIKFGADRSTPFSKLTLGPLKTNKKAVANQ